MKPTFLWETSERRGGKHLSFSECVDLPLNWSDPLGFEPDLIVSYRDGGLYQYTSFTVVCRKAHQKVPKFPEGKEPLINILADSREIEYTLVPNTKGKPDLWKHFNLRRRKTDGWIDAVFAVCDQCSSFVKYAGSISNMWTHMKRHHPLLLLGSPVGNERKTDTLVRISKVGIPVFYTGTDLKYQCTCRYIFCTGTQL